MTVLVDECDRVAQVIEPITGETLVAQPLVVPRETSIIDAHYDPAEAGYPTTAARSKTPTEREFLAWGEAAEYFMALRRGCGETKLGTEIGQILPNGSRSRHRRDAGRSGARGLSVDGGPMTSGVASTSLSLAC